MTFEITLTQTWQGKDHVIKRHAFLQKEYPLWLTIQSMDNEMYRSTGTVLPDRRWESYLVSLSDE